MQKTLPDDLALDISVDDSVFVSQSIYEVQHALVVALLLVLIVIYLFLGTVRATVPMMCSKIFANGIVRGRVAHAVDRFFQLLSRTYESSLRRALAAPAIVVVAGLLAFGLVFILFKALPSEYAPNEDRQRVFIRITAPEGASLQ